MKSVAQEGFILMIPETWVEHLEAQLFYFHRLTGDLSHGKSGIPVCYSIV